MPLLDGFERDSPSKLTNNGCTFHGNQKKAGFS